MHWYHLSYGGVGLLNGKSHLLIGDDSLQEKVKRVVLLSNRNTIGL